MIFGKRHTFASGGRWDWRLRAVLAVLAIGAEIFAWQASRQTARDSHPGQLGNTPAILARRPAPAADGTFSFAVFGDVQTGVPTFEDLASHLRTEYHFDFAIMIGDLVQHFSEIERRYFAARLAATGITNPVLVVAGNHDLAEGTFPLAEFEQEYGPADIAFMHGGCQFICLGRLVDEKYATDSLAFLERALRQDAGKARLRLLFMHYPPPAGEGYPNLHLPWGKALMELLARYHVEYVFSGHKHRLLRYHHGATTFIGVGSSGAYMNRDAMPTDTGMFYHAMVVTVRPDGVSEDLLAYDDEADWSTAGSDLRQLVVCKLMPLLQKRPALTLIVNLLLAGGLVLALLRLRRKPVAAPETTP